jgi:DNA-binding protein H-NS
MNRMQLLDEVNRLNPQERELLIHDVLDFNQLLEQVKKLAAQEQEQLIQEIQNFMRESQKQISPKPARPIFQSSNHSLEITPGVTFSREEMYADDE